MTEKPWREDLDFETEGSVRCIVLVAVEKERAESYCRRRLSGICWLLTWEQKQASVSYETPSLRNEETDVLEKQ